MKNFKNAKQIKEVFKHESVEIEIPFKLPTKILDRGYVITEMTISNLVYDRNWNLMEGSIDAKVTTLSEYCKQNS